MKNRETNRVNASMVKNADAIVRGLKSNADKKARACTDESRLMTDCCLTTKQSTHQMSRKHLPRILLAISPQTTRMHIFVLFDWLGQGS